MAHKNHQTDNTWARKRVYTLESYSLTEVQKFETAIFKAHDDDSHIGQNM
jgi:hypothetical protein